MDPSQCGDADPDGVDMPIVFLNKCIMQTRNQPSYVDKSLPRDRKLLRRIMDEGSLPEVDWRCVKREYQKYLAQLTHRAYVNVFFLDVSRKEGDPKFAETTSVDVDDVMAQNNAEGIVVHGKNMVYAATFTPQLCRQFYKEIELVLGYPSSIGEDGILAIKGGLSVKGMKKAGKSGKGTFPPFASFGFTPRGQGVRVLKSDTWQAKCWALGCPAMCSVEDPTLPHRIQSAVGSVYHADFYPLLKKRAGSNSRACQRFPLNPTADKKKRNYISLPLVASLPVASGPNADPEGVKAAHIETRLRTISEYLCLYSFGPLPYSSCGLIAAQNLSSANREFKKIHGLELPWSSLIRPFPKGSIGVHRYTPLHDDANGAVTPGVWTSLRGADDVYLNMAGHNMNINIRGTDRRFCWFMGWIPHRTIPTNGATCQNDGGEKTGITRIHHSAYSKLEIEHVCLHLFSPEMVCRTVSSISVDVPNGRTVPDLPVSEALPPRVLPARRQSSRRDPPSMSPFPVSSSHNTEMIGASALIDIYRGRENVPLSRTPGAECSVNTIPNRKRMDPPGVRLPEPKHPARDFPSHCPMPLD